MVVWFDDIAVEFWFLATENMSQITSNSSIGGSGGGGDCGGTISKSS